MNQKLPIHPANAPKPVGPYTPAIEAGGFVFVSGQGPLDPATNTLVGGGIEAEARQTLENIRTILAAAGCSMADVVKVSAHLADLKEFAAFNMVYREYFPEPFPARTTVQSGLNNIRVEIDVIACKGGR